MTIREKIQLILSISGMTQDQLSDKLGVSFVTVNRWLNEHARPRLEGKKRIDAIVFEYTGKNPDAEDSVDALSTKKIYLESLRKNLPHPLKSILEFPDICDQFVLALTFHTNSIEGSTFSEADTAVVLFENGTVSNKTLVEHLEAKNHQAALLYLFDELNNGCSISEELVLRLHGILMNGIRPDAGMYRNHAVRIVGTHVPTANFQSIAKRMQECIQQMNSRGDVFELLAKTHADFEQIHPFSDGNGRVGRLLLHAVALRAGFPPAVVRTQKRKEYMKSLNTAQMKNEYEGLVEFLCDSLIEGYKILERK